MKPKDLVAQVEKDLKAALKELRESGEDDLEKMGDALDDLAAKADAGAQKMYAADKALSGAADEDESDDDADEDDDADSDE